MTTIQSTPQSFIPPKLDVYNGRFYSGMKFSDLYKAKDFAPREERVILFKNYLKHNFNRIDKDKNGILSDEEILKERIVEKRKAGFGHFLIAAGLTLWTVLNTNKKNFKENKVLATRLLVLDIVLVGIELLNSIKNFCDIKKAKEPFTSAAKTQTDLKEIS